METNEKLDKIISLLEQLVGEKKKEKTCDNCRHCTLPRHDVPCTYCDDDYSNWEPAI